MVYDLLRALPGVHDFLVTVAYGSSSANLTPAQGCQDHTPSPSASTPFVRARDCTQAARVHRIPRSTSGDDWPKRPSSSRRASHSIAHHFEKRKYFFEKKKELKNLDNSPATEWAAVAEAAILGGGPSSASPPASGRYRLRASIPLRKKLAKSPKKYLGAIA